MKLTFKMIKDACKNTEFKVRSYSGRGMYGRTCVGIDLDRIDDLGDIIANLEPYDADGELYEPQDAFELVGKLISNMKWDSMGLGIIVYWPDIDYDKKAADKPHLSPAVALEGLQKFDGFFKDSYGFAYEHDSLNGSEVKDTVIAHDEDGNIWCVDGNLTDNVAITSSSIWTLSEE